MSFCHTFKADLTSCLEKGRIRKEEPKIQVFKATLTIFPNHSIHEMPNQVFWDEYFSGFVHTVAFGGCSWEQCIIIPPKLSTDFALLKSVKLQ